MASGDFLSVLAKTQFVKNGKTQFEKAKTQFSGYPLAWTGLDRQAPKENPNVFVEI